MAEPSGRVQFDWFRPKEAERLTRRAMVRRRWMRTLRGAFLVSMGLGGLGFAGSLIALLFAAFGTLDSHARVVAAVIAFGGIVVAVLILMMAGLLTRWAGRVEDRLKREMAEAGRLRAEHEALVNWRPDQDGAN